MLQVPGRLSLTSIEQSLSSILRAPDQKVLWPMNVRGIALGAEAALTQLMITWAVNARKPTQHFPIKSLNAEQVDSFVKQIHGLALSLLCNSAVDQSGQEYYDMLQANGLLKLSQMDGHYVRDALHRLHDLTILCADHLGRSSPRLIYANRLDRSQGVRNEKEFRLLAKWIIKSITPDNYQDVAQEFDAEAMGSMLHEIFENTDEHATRDIEGNALKKSVRGIFARHHWLSEHETKSLTAGYPALQTFCENIPVTATGGRRQLIEMSVFDAGPGFAQKISGKRLSDMSTKTEFEFVQACFQGGVTTKTHSGHGIGLRYVVRLLRKKNGFLRLRTGRLSLVADLSSNETTLSDDEFVLRDAAGSNIQRLGRMQGTLISILIPLSRQ